MHAGSRRPPTDEDYSHFVHATWPSLYRTAYLLVGDHGLAEDLVQTALAKTYGSWHRVRDLNAAGGYARTTLVNTASSWFRRRSWRRDIPTPNLPDQPLEAQPPDDLGIVQALSSLPPRQRAAVVLRYYDDLSVADTAQALGCSEGTVKSQTHDALARLRTLLGESFNPHTSGAHHD